MQEAFLDARIYDKWDAIEEGEAPVAPLAAPLRQLIPGWNHSRGTELSHYIPTLIFRWVDLIAARFCMKDIELNNISKHSGTHGRMWMDFIDLRP